MAAVCESIHEAANQPVIGFHPALVAIADGSMTGGVVLAGLIHQQVRAEAQGHFEWTCPQQRWCAMLALSRKAICEAMGRLQGKNMLSVRRVGSPPYNCYALEWDVLEQAWQSVTGRPFSRALVRSLAVWPGD
jgi:hypothetical protein